MKFKIRHFAAFSLIALLLGIGISSFHHHAEGRIRSECPLCRYQYSGISAVTESGTADIEPVLALDETVPDFHAGPPCLRIVCDNARPNAPPLAS